MRVLRSQMVAVVLLLCISGVALQAADDSRAKSPQESEAAAKTNEIADRIFYREAKFVQDLKPYTPVVETYIQNFKANDELGQVPTSDKYFIGRLVMDKGIEDISFQQHTKSPGTAILEKLDGFYKMNYVALGFMQMVYIYGFDKSNYDLTYLHQEFLGDVRTLVFDVSPKPKVKGPHFEGRIWVEDQDYTIVRFNGTYIPQRMMNFFFHFDSWRLNIRPGTWLPAFIYTEESDARYALFRKLAMRSQTRLWGYSLKLPVDTDEFTAIQIDPASNVSDQTATANEIVPVESTHDWQREAEDDVLDRLQRAGLLAPEGDVSKVLETVINNIEITNKLDIQPEIRARVLLTTPLESFTVGHTIVVSRGLLDVLPDEASLAMVLAHELAHIALGHSLDTKYAFGDRMVFPDEQTFERIQLAHSSQEEEAANRKAMEFLQNSPYKDKLATAGLFLRSLEAHSKELSSLITPQFGSRMAKGNNVLFMSALLQSAPALQPDNVTQLAALPLGSRIKLDPWDDTVELNKSKAVALLSARDKMAFQVTPMIPHLARYSGPEIANAAASGK
ncbi:MAG TPA: M48 family metalloprotease [Verrucomicrobiae bacterium]|nr:M48 family metalloprotease [Verrucomicrobiae bacterium]